MIRSLVTLLALVGLPAVSATGIMIPKPVGIPNLAIRSHRASVTITDQVAQTHVEQVFRNHTDQQLEATFIFPLPAGASVSEFAMMMNGKRVVGEVLEKDRARQIYTDIVRRMKDPGLLEYMGSNLFKASIFPIPPRGDQKIEITYNEVITHDTGLAEYVLPMKTGDRASTTLEDFSISVELKSKTPIKSVYSPTHAVDVVKKGDHDAKVSFEQNQATLDRDFRLLYSVSEKDFGVNIVTHRTADKDGYLLLMISPKGEVKNDEILPKDVCFVVDTSGSMSGQKIEQARKALQYCINSLDERDRFNVIRFSTDVELFQETLVTVTKKNVEAATKFVGDFVARGGTDIDLALRKALEMKTNEKRPYQVVFLTDGKPTIGTTDPKRIIDNIKEQVTKDIRTFVFGVGHDINTHLLDQIASSSRAATQYVSPEEDIEVKVSAFFDKVNAPVLSDLKLNLGEVRAYDIYPKELPDLFKGNQLLVLARFREKGDYAIKLTGEINGKQQEFVYEGSYPEVNKENKYIPQIWANRKVGYLLDEIRLKGEDKELVSEVTALGKEFGIVTPYTSYLIVEDEKQEQIGGIRRSRGQFGAGGPDVPNLPRPAGEGGARERRELAKGIEIAQGAESVDVDRTDISSVTVGAPFSPNARELRKKAELVNGLKHDSGKDAVTASEALQSLKEQEIADSAGATRITGSATALGRAFEWSKGIWTDSQWKTGNEPLKVKYLSDAYFKLLTKDADLKDAFALGENVLVVLKSGKAILISAEGKDDLTDAELVGLFTK
ncbi:MAG: VIT domain-containing protein [Planctomycetota bacterium]|nr:VIT domain-containing protein [Planctomycetota bacterium]MDA1141667.1 VIT domain-containing protein [Planctomycetota bacterium]